MKYETNSGIPCTPEEEKLIDSLKRLGRKWRKNGKRLMLFSWAGDLCVIMMDNDGYIGEKASDNLITSIDGIPNDGGDPD